MPVKMNDEMYLSTDEACSAIGVTRETLNRYVNKGLITRYKKGLGRTALYKDADVQALIEKRSAIREADE